MRVPSTQPGLTGWTGRVSQRCVCAFRTSAGAAAVAAAEEATSYCHQRWIPNRLFEEGGNEA